MIQPWTATCVQVLNHTVNHVSTREAALEIVNRSIDRWEILVLGGIAPGQARPNNSASTRAVPGICPAGLSDSWRVPRSGLRKPVSRFPDLRPNDCRSLAQKLGIFVAANSYERDTDWPGIYFQLFISDQSGWRSYSEIPPNQYTAFGISS